MCRRSWKKRNQTKIAETKKNKISDHDTRKNEIINE